VEFGLARRQGHCSGLDSKCNGLFEKDAVTGVWMPSTSGTGIPGWEVNFRERVEWDWAKLPVCDVYKDRNFDTVPVTVGAYDKRQQQLNDFLQNTIPADIYAFQEVSGEQAVREALPDGGSGYHVCRYCQTKFEPVSVRQEFVKSRPSQGCATRRERRPV
jgi:hypothetical protein